MSLRGRTLVAVAVVVATVLAGLAVGLRAAWLAGLARVEADAARDTHRRVRSELVELNDRLAGSVADWALRDATFEVAHGRHPGFLRDELGDPAVYQRLTFHLAAVFDADGNVVARRVVRGGVPADRTARYWAAPFWNTLTERALDRPGARTGLAVVDEGTLLLAAHRIQRRTAAAGDRAAAVGDPPAAPRDHAAVPRDHAAAAGDHAAAPRDHAAAPRDHAAVPRDHAAVPRDHAAAPRDHAAAAGDRTAAPRGRPATPGDPRAAPDAAPDDPPAGVLVFGRFIDDRVRAAVAGSEQVRVSVHPLGLSGADPDALSAAAEIARGTPLLVRTTGDDAITVYSVLPDIEGRPAVVVRSRADRTLWREARAASLLALGAIVAVVVLFGVPGLLILDRSRLRRLTALGAELHRIRASRDPAARVAVAARGELGALQRAVNELLEGLQQVERERAASAYRLRQHEAIVFAAERIVCLHSWEEGAPVILARLGDAADASRVALFEFGSPDPLTSCRVGCRWAKQGVSEPLAPAACRRAREFAVRLSGGAPVEVRWASGDREDRDVLEQRQAGALLLVPVIVDGRSWGAICAEDLDRSRTWSVTDREALAAAAKMIGAAVAAEAARRELLDAKQTAEAAAAAKGEFLATMSHEIRTPLNAVIGLSDLALETHDPSERATYLRLVRSSAHALLALVNNILDFSRIDAGRLEVERLNFELHKWVAEVASSFKQQARQKGISLAARVASDVPRFVVGDPGRLRQVAVNLLGNALKFTESGEVSLRVALAEKTASGLQLLFEVRDTGIGIPSDKLDSVFQPFTQADSTTTRRFGGSGLGLAICQSLVRLMGGRIWVESGVGTGSAFCFTACVGHATSSEEAISGPVPVVARGAAVLLAEDNEVNQLLARRLLEREGHVVTTVATGAAAVDAVRSGTFDLVLMDVQMPVMDGLAATAAIRARESGGAARLPIIAMTANAMPGDRERCLAVGMDGYIAKPIKVKELLAEINRLLAPVP